MEKQSWNGNLTEIYEKNLGLHGGYSRKINRNLPSSLSNSEYVKSDDSGLWVVARGGHRIQPVRTQKELHYNHPYGNVKSAQQIYNSKIKKLYAQRLKKLKR